MQNDVWSIWSFNWRCIAHNQRIKFKKKITQNVGNGRRWQQRLDDNIVVCQTRNWKQTKIWLNARTKLMIVEFMRKKLKFSTLPLRSRGWTEYFRNILFSAHRNAIFHAKKKNVFMHLSNRVMCTQHKCICKSLKIIESARAHRAAGTRSTYYMRTV